jgi:hypothetical protein
MVYLCLTRRKQDEDPAIDVIVEARITLRNIDDCVIKDGNGLGNDLKVTPRDYGVSSSKTVLSLTNRSHMRTESSIEIKCHIRNSTVLQHMKNNNSLTKQNFWIFTVSTFDSCGIETISQEFSYHHKQFNFCIPEQCRRWLNLDTIRLLSSLQSAQANKMS